MNKPARDAAFAAFSNHWFGSSHGSIKYCLDRALDAYNAHDATADEVDAGVRAMFEGPHQGQNNDLIVRIVGAALRNR